MPTLDEPHELDDRFPTGEWKGFYVQPDSRQRYAMDLVLAFAQDRISGTGDDVVGQFTIHGAYDTITAECSWTKHYVGQHSVEYAGRARQGGIIGQWRIPGRPGFWCGPFFIWPRASGDLESAFEKAFLEYELAMPRADSPSVTESMPVFAASVARVFGPKRAEKRASRSGQPAQTTPGPARRRSYGRSVPAASC